MADKTPELCRTVEYDGVCDRSGVCIARQHDPGCISQMTFAELAALGRTVDAICAFVLCECGQHD